MTGRKKTLLAGNMNPDRLRVVRTYLDPVMTVEMFGWDRSSGLLDLEDLESKMS